MELRTLEIVANTDGTLLEVLEVVDVKDPFTPHTIHRLWTDIELGRFMDTQAKGTNPRL
jgi:hypothetical protein